MTAPLSPTRLRQELLEAGIANAAIDAAWPNWWSDDAASSASASAELVFTVARRLGLSAEGLFDGSASFIWRDDTKFKNLGTRSHQEQAALSSFGIAVGRSALRGTDTYRAPDATATQLRNAALNGGRLVNLRELVAVSWAFGIPVLQLKLFPLRQKRMHAMAVKTSGRYAILLGVEYNYEARAAFVLAHELGHIFLGHLESAEALLDIDDPVTSDGSDLEEVEADRFALTLLTGSPTPDVVANFSEYSATQLARAAVDVSAVHLVDPGIIALCLGYSTGNWKQSLGALKIIPPGRHDVRQSINMVASQQLDWASLSFDDQEYLARIIGLYDEP